MSYFMDELNRDDAKCYLASKNGQLGYLKHAHENGCPWDHWTCRLAAMNGHLVCLKYAHEKGCSWDEWTCHFAAKNGQLGYLKHAHENGCPMGPLDVSFSCNERPYRVPQVL